ncbi:MAG: nitroreductase family protein [Spirochaetia bacterium]|jgi:nitroreductase/NAD-dependent dihydropyrimidine dehydrogenase PreA subunit
MIVHDGTKCRECGVCLAIREGHCLQKSGAEIRVDPLQCNECGECVARCPSQAFAFQGHPTQRLDPEARAKPKALVELLAGRRSTRRFTDAPVDRKTLLQLAVMARYAPSMNHDIEAVLIDDTEILRRIDKGLFAFYARMYRLLFKNPLVFGFIRLFADGMDVTKKKLEHSMREGRILYNAPALMLLTGKKRVPLTELSAQFQLSHMMLYAESLGLGTCLMDSVKIGVNASAALRRLLGIQPGHAVVGALHVGYPTYPVRNIMPALSLRVRIPSIDPSLTR